MPKGIYKRTRKARENMRQSKLGNKNALGYKQSEEHKEKIRQACLGKKVSMETREKMRQSAMGSTNGFQEGENNFNWQGGITDNPYAIDWTKTLRKSIRQRDRYTCQICGKEPATSVHHIDYNKLNNNPDNLITLCRKCHAKTNYDREYWIEYFGRRK